MRGLIIDDEQLIMTTTAILLRHIGIVPIIAANGQDGISLAVSAMPDFILLDIMMPAMSGWQVLAILKSNPETSGIPVIICTAIDSIASGTEAALLGVDAILRKPFHLSNLVSAIDSAVAKEAL